MADIDAFRFAIDKWQFFGVSPNVNDLEVLAAVGLSAMAGNSPILDQFSPDYVTTRHGGNGSFR